MIQKVGLQANRPLRPTSKVWLHPYCSWPLQILSAPEQEGMYRFWSVLTSEKHFRLVWGAVPGHVKDIKNNLRTTAIQL